MAMIPMNEKQKAFFEQEKISTLKTQESAMGAIYKARAEGILGEYQMFTGDGLIMWDISSNERLGREAVKNYEYSRPRRSGSVQCDDCEKYRVGSGMMGPRPMCYEVGNFGMVEIVHGRPKLGNILFNWERNEDNACPDYERKWWKFWAVK